MANNGSSNTALVVIFILVILGAIAVFFAYRGGYFSKEEKKLDIKVEVPAPQQPAPTNPY